MQLEDKFVKENLIVWMKPVFQLELVALHAHAFLRYLRLLDMQMYTYVITLHNEFPQNYMQF